MWQRQDLASLQACGVLLEKADCKTCESVLQNEGCLWSSFAESARGETCSLCNRIQGDCLLIVLVLGGLFVKTHRYELLNCVFTEAKNEYLSCPMKRIVAIEEHMGRVWVATSDIGLARKIGDALSQTFRGRLDYFYNAENNCLRVEWAH